MATSESADAILAMLTRIPAGQVATYGQIAALAGYPRNARQVGSILRKLKPGKSVPWFRVLNSKGEISRGGSDACRSHQRGLLEDEGVTFDDQGRVPLNKFQWHPND